MDERLLKDYNSYLRIERAMSRNTVASYCSDVEAFLEWYCGAAEAISNTSIEEYLQFRDGISRRSQARVLSSLRSFCSWLVLEGIMKENPCDKVDSPKLGRYLPDVLSVGEVMDIMDSVDLATWQGVRDRAILETLYGCGLRVSEAASLRISGLYFEDGFVRVVGKGNKERIVPLGEIAAESIGSYLQVRPLPRDAESDDILFLSQSFATHLIENGADLRVVQEMLGHESITTTEIYTHVEASSWQRNIMEHHPRMMRKSK